MKELLFKHITSVREQAPLVQNITNYVVMNNTANALLAVGASPIMAHAHPEMQSMQAICQALVINIGTLDEYWVESMKLAVAAANQNNKPWILDPVGAGATAYRDEVLSELLALKPTAIRGNASEILALAKHNTTATKGVDSTSSSLEAIEAAQFLNKEYGALVVISGAVDIVVSEESVDQLKNGDALMTKITGMGCSATAILAAFIAVIPNKKEAALAATSLMAVAGELAAKSSQGPGSLQMHLLDKLHSITKEEYINTVKILD
ncbi:MAG TPA: hydroxyethylthiazole kinase [Leeuwenhoekiella sp.]|uniref:hydroxyethylthiazole kinase n=1 Tax=Leeuwenhoekiella palythoae TaxID=573501 RepID=UPI000EBDF02C|nr:hydroxyethylthiazole kinase [Leeuwenhoekiella palythoae]UBZ09486.1 hydroxyethylthiazole kinase [Leeuwenhoekiella palythoae]HBO28879.1 hydroxyethylthiazole kinase [Leeuwenhoekiella sp.]HCQ75724.1 hydroxyethylthiazole kinase [Leeuwenhoekiella sp.]|tara:strand:+ start:853 stop:1647 length:795 start_codon:yes stop_codon:yes gene_type:complete